MHYLKYIFLIFLTTCCVVLNAQVKTVTVDKENNILKTPNAKAFKDANDIASKSDIKLIENAITSTSICLYVDLYRDGINNLIVGDKNIGNPLENGIGDYWTDCEVKVLDKYGNMIYFYSTAMFEQLTQQYHSECVGKTVAQRYANFTYDHKYANYMIIEDITKVKTYYYVSGNQINGDGGIYQHNGFCAKQKKRWNQTISYGYLKSIGEQESAGNETGIDPEGFRHRVTAIQIFPDPYKIQMFLDPNNSVLINRKNDLLNERDGNKQREITHRNIYGSRVWRPALIQYFNEPPEN